MSASKTATKKTAETNTYKHLVEHLQDSINAKLDKSLAKLSKTLNTEDFSKLCEYVFTPNTEKKPKEKRIIKVKKEFNMAISAIIEYIGITYKLQEDYDKEFFKTTYTNEDSGFFSVIIKKYIDLPFDFRGNKSHNIIVHLLKSINDGTNNDVLYAELLAKFFEDFAVYVANRIFIDILNDKLTAFELSRNSIMIFIIHLIASEEVGENMLSYNIIEKNNKLFNNLQGLETQNLKQIENKTQTNKKETPVKKKEMHVEKKEKQTDETDDIKKKIPAKKKETTEKKKSTTKKVTKGSKVIPESEQKQVSEESLNLLFDNMVSQKPDLDDEDTNNELFENLINGFDEFDSNKVEDIFK
jgi:hypothetical protein